MSYENFKECIDACSECVVFCNRCAVACTQEAEVQHLANCIRLDLECAAICDVSVQVMSLNGVMSEKLCEICAEICNRCAEECENHRQMEHCKECARVCRKCAEICAEMTESA